MALNKLKKWIGTQAMTAFFDRLNDNVDATNAVIDLAEQKANKEQESWKTLPLQNNWVMLSGLYARYYKDELGRVYVEGYITGGTDISFAIMPTGYRTDRNLTIPYVSSAGAFIGVYTNGQLRFTGGVTGDVYFNFNYRAVD